MFAFTSPADIALLGALIVALVLAIRLLAGDEPVDLAAMFGAATPLPWPRGVQEEEPLPWRLDLLDRRPEPTIPRVEPRLAPGPAANPTRTGCATG